MKVHKIKLLLLTLVLVSQQVWASNDYGTSEKFLCSGPQVLFLDIQQEHGFYDLKVSGFNQDNKFTSFTIPLAEDGFELRHKDCVSYSKKSYKVSTRDIFGMLKVSTTESSDRPGCNNKDLTSATFQSRTFKNQPILGLKLNGEFSCRKVY